MMAATPALLSAPSSVVPEAVTMSLPTCRRSAGISDGLSTIEGSSGSTMSPPCQLECTIGLTPAPLSSGEVSTWAMKPITGTCGFLLVAGTVAMTTPSALRAASPTPSSFSSRTRRSSSASCFSVLGDVDELSEDCVSIAT